MQYTKPTDQVLYDTIRVEAPSVASRLLSRQKRFELLDDACHDTFLNVRWRIHHAPQLAKRLSAPGELAAYVRKSLKTRILRLLRNGSRRSSQDDGLLLAAQVDGIVYWPQSFEVDAAGTDLGLVCAELRRPTRSKYLAECRQEAFRVLELFLRADVLPAHPLDEKWFDRGRKTLRRAAEKALLRKYGATARNEIRDALRSLRTLIVSQNIPQAAQTSLTRVGELLALFRARRGAREYRKRLRALSADAVLIANELVDGASRNDLLCSLASRCASVASQGVSAPDEVRAAAVILDTELSKIEQAFLA